MRVPYALSVSGEEEIEAVVRVYNRYGALIFTSTEDHVVPTISSDTLAAAAQGPVERITLARSYHVATLDYDRELIERETVAFALRVTGQAGELAGTS